MTTLRSLFAGMALAQAAAPEVAFDTTLWYRI